MSKIPDTFPCPNCQKQTAFKDSSLTDPRIQKYYEIKDQKWPLEASNNRKVQWYCKDCLQNQNIHIANWEKQELYGYLCFKWMPILYYQSKIKNCKMCHQDFTFSAAEQQTWYEEYRIYTDITAPKMCYSCRKKAKFIKSINEELQPLLQSAKIEPTKAKFQRIADLYLKLENPQKAGMYLAKAKQF